MLIKLIGKSNIRLIIVGPLEILLVAEIDKIPKACRLTTHSLKLYFLMSTGTMKKNYN